MRALLALPVCILAGSVLAQAPEPMQAPDTPLAVQPSDLPLAAQVKIALERDPMVRAATSGIGYEQTQQQRLDAGSYEFTVRGDAARRRVTEPEIPGNFNEWGVALERPLRLPNKGSLDRNLGAQGVSVARLSAGDAMHEAGRSLLRLWFAWMKENAQLAVWQQQAELARQQQATVQKRKRAGDAPKMELNLAEAAALQAESSSAQARSREVTARNTLVRTFPAITVPEKATLAEPRALAEGVDFWNEQILNHNHQLAAARAEVTRRELLTKRANAERVPDPTVGIRYSNEFGGTEKVTGLYFTIPLPGSARTAARDGTRFQTEQAQDREAAVLRQVEVEIATAVESANANYETWQQLRRAAEGMRQHAELTARAYQLGEAGLPEVLVARRMALESELAAMTAQLDAQESRYRLLLDAHRLWPLDPAEGADGHVH